MNTKFDEIVAALKANNYIAIDDHKAYMANPADREVNVEVIGSIFGDAVFLEDLKEMGAGYSINRMTLDEDGVVHISKASCAVLHAEGRSMLEAIRRHNAYPENTRKILDVTFLAKTLATIKIDDSTATLTRQEDGMFAVFTQTGFENTVTFHELKEKAAAEFKRLVAEMINTKL